MPRSRQLSATLLRNMESASPAGTKINKLSIRETLLWIIVAAFALHLAYCSVAGSYLIQV